MARSAGVNLREEHVHGDFHVRDNVTISYLDVLHFGRISFTFEGLNTYKLDFNGLDLKVTLFHEQVAIKALGEATVDRSNLARELKLWVILNVLYNVFGFDRILLGDVRSSMLGVNTVSRNCTVELSEARLHLTEHGSVTWSLNLHRDFVNDRKVNSDVGVDQGIRSCALEGEFKANGISGPNGTSSG